MLDAYVAGAIDRDLLAEEQTTARRETTEIANLLAVTSADLGRAAVNADAAINLLDDAARTYERASGTGRRLLNQVLFKRFLVDKDAIEGELTDPFQTLLESTARCSEKCTRP